MVLEIDEIKDIQWVKNNLNEYISEYIAEDFIDHPEIKLNFEFYDSEVMMIRRFMNLVHTNTSSSKSKGNTIFENGDIPIIMYFVFCLFACSDIQYKGKECIIQIDTV